MLVEDLLVLVMMVILSLVKLLFHSKKSLSLKWYNIIIGPLFCIIIHSYHFLVGFVLSPRHATSMLVFYALILITFIVTLKSAYHNMFKFCVHCFGYANDADTRDREPTSRNKVAHFCVLFFLFCISVFVGLTFIYIAFLFILVPINNVIENAPDRILNINQTILILFGAAITFKLYQSRRFDSLLDYLVRAADEHTESYPQLVERAEMETWEQNNRKQKRKAIASVILSALNKQALDQKPINQDETINQGDPARDDQERVSQSLKISLKSGDIAVTETSV